MKLTLLLLLTILFGAGFGCSSSGVTGQPKLHSPISTLVREVESSKTPATNRVVKAPKGNMYARLAQSREAGDPQTGSTNGAPAVELIRPSTNDNVVSFLQIAADSDVIQEFGATFASCFYVGEVIIENQNSNTFLAYGASMDVNVAYYVSEADWEKSPELQALMFQRFRRESILSHRRPSTYSDVLAVFEFQRRSNWKQQLVDYLKSAGEIAAGATVFVGGELYSKGVAFATGIITPEIEKRLLWDILLHAKNLEARSLKDVEEVPPHSAIHRLVFFPKRGIPGVVDGHLVYISSFSDQSAKSRQPVLISGSLIEKTKSAKSAELVETRLSEGQ